jgi:hypothetical protein
LTPSAGPSFYDWPHRLKAGRKDFEMPHLAKMAVVAALSLALLTAGCGGSGKKGNGYGYAPISHRMAAVL